MAGYGLKDVNRALRERKDSKPRANYCGACGDECDSLICDECRGDWQLVTAAAEREVQDER